MDPLSFATRNCDGVLARTEANLLPGSVVGAGSRCLLISTSCAEGKIRTSTQIRLSVTEDLDVQWLPKSTRIGPAILHFLRETAGVVYGRQ
jgi:hypothetical protein